MFTSKLALLVVLLTWGATTAYAYPTAEHMLPSPVPSAVTNTAERDPNANAARQIHNADYHANAPPPSPNPASPQDAPANPPAPAQSAPPAATKAKRLVKSFGPGPVVVPCPSTHTTKDEVAVKPPTAITHMHSSKRFLGDALEQPAAPVAANANSYGNSNGNPNLALAARAPPTNNDLYGLHRRAVEELTNASNRNFDHNAVVRWSRDEVDRMQAYSRAT